MVLRYSAALRNLQAQQIAADAGSGARIRIYTGTQPASVATAASGTLLGELVVSGAFGTAVSGVLTFSTVTPDSSADNSGTAQWFRVFKADGTTGVLDGSVTVTGGGGEMTLNTTSITAGGTISLSSPSTITVGNQ